MDRQDVNIMNLVLSQVLVGNFVIDIYKTGGDGSPIIDEEARTAIRTSPTGFSISQENDVMLNIRVGRIEVYSKNYASKDIMTDVMTKYASMIDNQGQIYTVGINGALLFSFREEDKHNQFEQKYFPTNKVGALKCLQYNKNDTSATKTTFTLLMSNKDKQEVFVLGINNQYNVKDINNIHRILSDVGNVKYDLLRELEKILR